MFKWVVKILPVACLTVCLTTGVAWAATSPFIGEWQFDPSKSRLPDEMKVESQGGAKYGFDFGGVVESIVIDGGFQPGYGKTFLSVQAAAPDTWIVQRKEDDKLQINARWTLSKDGQTLTDDIHGLNPDGSELSMNYAYQHTGAGSGFVGVWRSVRETMTSPMSLQVKAFEGDGLTFTITTLRSTRNAKPDGKEYPKAAPGATTSAQKVDERTLEITEKAGGKVVLTEEVGLSADLKTLTMTMRFTGRDRPNVLVFVRT